MNFTVFNVQWFSFFTSFQTHNERIELKVLIYLSFDLIKELTSYNSAPSFIYIIRRKVRANSIFKQFNNSFRSFEDPSIPPSSTASISTVAVRTSIILYLLINFLIYSVLEFRDTCALVKTQWSSRVNYNSIEAWINKCYSFKLILKNIARSRL